MDNQISFKLKNLNAPEIEFYKCLLQNNSNQTSSLSAEIQVSKANELFEVITQQFDKLENPKILVALLKVADLAIQQSDIATCQLISESIQNLLQIHAPNEKHYLITLHLLQQFLKSLPNVFPIEKQLVEEIINPNGSIKVQNQIATCICVLIDKFQITPLLDIMWMEILKKKSPNLLLNYLNSLITHRQVYDNFKFWSLIETFLLADADRKMAIFTIRKVLTFLSTTQTKVKVGGYFIWPQENLLTSWLTYLTIFENLEEKQSHLILPALQMLDNIHLGNNTPWLRILLQQMLRHKNNLVIRWSVNKLFANFSKLVLENGILKDFFNATNNTWLFNEKQFTDFPPLQLKKEHNFLDIFTEIPWKSVPMHVWLQTMQHHHYINWNEVTYKTILDVATRIRQLQNPIIRSDCRDLFVSLAWLNIKDMSLEEYLNFIEALHSSSEKLSKNRLLPLLLTRIQECCVPFLTYNVFLILTRQNLDSSEQEIIVKELKTIELIDHKWFSVLLVYFFDDYFIETKEDKDVLLKELYGDDKKLFLCWDDLSKTVVRQLEADSRIADSLTENVSESDFEDFIQTGGMKTLLKLTGPNKRSFQLSVRMVNAVISELRSLVKRQVDILELIRNITASCQRDQPNSFYEYVNEILDIDITNAGLAFDVFSNCLDFLELQRIDARKLLIRGLLFGEPLTGDARMEHSYVVKANIKDVHNSEIVRSLCLGHLPSMKTTDLKLLQVDLIELSKSMSIRKPRYFENSKHHRLKLRIAHALTLINQLVEYDWHEYYLDAILHENNQTNVTYMFEFLVGQCIDELRLMKLFENLSQLSPSCQSSIFAIAFIFCKFHEENSKCVKFLVKKILPWTMGANFNTRLHAQMAVYHLIKNFLEPKSEMNDLVYAIEGALKESPNAFEKLHTDIRFNFSKFLLSNQSSKSIAEAVLYVTAVPEDENLSKHLNISNNVTLNDARRLFVMKKESTKEEQETNFDVIEDVQRKMNPDIDLSDHLNSKQLGGKQSDMIVVASLIDKLPNLGGIARTCEVLGIRELILDSAKHTQNKEFKNLSMTAENWLNIKEVRPKGLKEFLLEKQIEGYQIVGAEQTSNSVNFMEFKFPKKCVLLLGHEKEGIPADLIALLDYAVEIPQFGMVRSLNVHVTGALFMYEYSKQHYF